MIKIVVPGINGRMGAVVAEQVLASKDLKLVGATARVGNSSLGSKFHTSDVVISDTFPSDFDLIIDFTLPEGVIDHLAFNKPMVIGTTGFTNDQMQLIKNAALRIPILMASNMSIGVNQCYKLLAQANDALDSNWQTTITDIHHVHKKDMPSGTAKQIANILSKHNPIINSERRDEVIGEHSVVFDNGFEEIVITHKAKDRSIFARGAVQAARWLLTQQPGLYSMQDYIE